MNKHLITLAGIAGLALSMNAAAGTIAGNPAGVKNAPVNMTSDCLLLQEDIKINLSKNVEAGYDCNTTTNTIGVAACHPNGVKIDATGNNNIFIGSSAGGSVVADTVDAAALCSAANAQTDAAAVALRGSGS